MINLDAVFIIYNGGFICSNDASIDINTDVIRGLDGKSRSIKRIKLLKGKNIFIHGEISVKDQDVICLTKMILGNVFHYEGYISFISNENIEVTITSKANKDRIQEIINAVASL